MELNIIDQIQELLDLFETKDNLRRHLVSAIYAMQINDILSAYLAMEVVADNTNDPKAIYLRDILQEKKDDFSF